MCSSDLAWQIRSADLRNMAIWRMVPHCVIWCLWRERNARLFEDCESSIVDIKSFVFGDVCNVCVCACVCVCARANTCVCK